MSQDQAGISPALEDALRGAQIGSRDAGAVALARRYARLLDEPAVNARYRRMVGILERVTARYVADTANPRDVAAAEDMLATVTVALGEHSVASDLGPKLLAVLQQLGLTLAARKEGPGDSAPARPATKLDELKARRAARQYGAADLDASAP